MDMTLLFILFCLLQIGDFITTKIILNNGGVELNPIMRKLFEKVGVSNGLLFTKLSIIILFFFLIHLQLITDWAMLILIAVYLFVVYNNYRQIKKMEL